MQSYKVSHQFFLVCALLELEVLVVDTNERNLNVHISYCLCNVKEFWM